MNETTLTRAIRKWLQDHGWKVWKISDRFASGRPDLYVLKKGRSIWFEVKVPGGKVTKLQAHEIDDILSHGGEAYVVRSIEDVVSVSMDRNSTEASASLYVNSSPLKKNEIHGLYDQSSEVKL